MPEISNDLFTAMLIRNRIGEQAWGELMARLPGSFFQLGSNGKAMVWRAVLKAANSGTSDPGVLEQIATGVIVTAAEAIR